MFYRIRSSMLLPFVAFAMTLLFWWPLYMGAGFIGGDLYPYFFPQKAFYADWLKAGKFPLWNDLAGFGYPILGESQTGAAYPFHILFYRYFALNSAYNLEHLLHYWICFVAVFLFARRVGLKNPGSCLAAIVFTYGWFPPRACLEWAILTGAWMPVALFCVESFLQTRLWRYAIGLSFAIGMQLLAGHYHLAFVTQLLVVGYSAWRLWSEKQSKIPCDNNSTCSRCRTSAATGIVLAVLAGVGLAFVQVLPTWELKQRSSRVVASSDYDPAYGFMPPLYVSQLVVPWYWYNLTAIYEDNIVRDAAEVVAPWHWFGPSADSADVTKPYDLDKAIERCQSATASTGTNKVEAHIYCGMFPVSLAAIMAGAWVWQRCRKQSLFNLDFTLQNTVGFWLAAGLIALIYATGVLLPIGRHIPGFSFFRGPGRYGIVTTFSIALLAGAMLSQILGRISSRVGRVVLTIIIFASTCGDLWLVSRMVKYSVMVSPPAIKFREESTIRQILRNETTPPRLLAPMPNVANLLGVSSVPWYLGIAPAEYVDARYAMPPIPKPPATKGPTSCTPDLIDWLSRSGVTHILNFEPIDELAWQAERLWVGIDPFVNRIIGRSEPIYLYRFHRKPDSKETFSFPGRAYLTAGEGQIEWSDWKEWSPDSRRFTLHSKRNGFSTITLTELDYPGWTVRQGDRILSAKRDGLFRSIEVSETGGDIAWRYEPSSVHVGLTVSLASLFLLAVVSHFRFWHPEFTSRLVRKMNPFIQ